MGISQLTCVLYSNYCNGMNENLPKHCIVFLGNIFLHWTKNLNSKTLVIYRAVRYDDIYRMDEINSLSFHIMFYRLFRCVAKYIVYGNTFSSFEWLWSLHAAHHGAWRGDRSRMRTTSQDKTEQLVPKRGTTSVAWSRVFKHRSFKTTDLKPLKHKTTELYACAVSFCVRGARFFFFADFEQLHKHTYMRQNPCLCNYPHKHSDLGLKKE